MEQLAGRGSSVPVIHVARWRQPGRPSRAVSARQNNHSGGAFGRSRGICRPRRSAVHAHAEIAFRNRIRRAVVAQVVSYAGYLQGLDLAQLESQILREHLSAAGSVLGATRPTGARR